jgi:hypothetical protein
VAHQGDHRSRYPAVPHIVDPPPSRSNLRAEFGVPDDAFVVGRHGASDQFKVPFVAGAIEAALQRRKNLWLMLLNTDRFSTHERIIHLPRAGHRQRVADFVGTCDAGLNARLSGEAFGLSIAEFLAEDKPMLVWEGGRDRNHLELVDDPRFRYRTRSDLTQKLVELERGAGDGTFRARVDEFTPRASDAHVRQHFSRAGRAGMAAIAARVPARFTRAGATVSLARSLLDRPLENVVRADSPPNQRRHDRDLPGHDG